MERQSFKLWGEIAAGVFAVQIAVCLTLKPGYALTAFGDILQTAICAVLTVLAIRNARARQPSARLFWSCMACGFAAWTFLQASWLYYEVILRRAIHNPFIGDVFRFFHVVPFIAALALRPDRSPVVRKHLASLDFTLLLLWWISLYFYAVLPWQYAQHDMNQYSANFMLLYTLENATWLSILAVLVRRTTGEWRRIYAGLFSGGAIYLVASYIVAEAVIASRYYTGSLFDLPLNGSMLMFLWVVGGALPERLPELAADEISQEPASGALARLAMLAMLSLPLLALWSIYGETEPHRVVVFRLETSLLAIFILGIVVFWKLYLLDRERMRLYRETHHNYLRLQRLQGQLIRSAKMVALGQLVGGAAHEINNPLAAILGYADLIHMDPSATAEVRSNAAKIGQQVHRTKNIVSNLLRFASRSASVHAMVDLNAIAEQTAQLREMEYYGKNVIIRRQLDPALPSVWGDASLLTDVCFHLLGNAADALVAKGGGIAWLRTSHHGGHVLIEVVDEGSGMLEPERVFDPFYTTKGIGKGMGLGLSVCYGIIRDHKGEIVAENLPEGGARFVIRLPIGDPAQHPA